MKTVAILSLLLLAFLVPWISASAGAPQGDPGNWVCPDGTQGSEPTTGSVTLAAGIAAAATYRVHNNNNDGGIVEVTNAEGTVLTTVEINGNSSVDVGVPQGGTLKVKDPPDSGSTHPGGSYETV